MKNSYEKYHIVISYSKNNFHVIPLLGNSYDKIHHYFSHKSLNSMGYLYHNAYTF